MAYIGGSQTGDYSVFKITRAWVEDEANWTNASKSQTWAKAGGDFVSKAIDKKTCPRSVGKVWVKYNVLPAVEEFVKDSSVNYGFMIINTAKTQEIDFPSSENAKADLRPKLTVSYTEPPTPALSSPAALHNNGVVVRVDRRGLILDGQRAAAPVEVIVSRPDGKRQSCCRLAPGVQRRLPVSAAGMCIITIRDRFGSRTLATFAP